MPRRAALALLVATACGAAPASPRAPAAPNPFAQRIAALDEYLARAEASGFSGAVLVAVHGEVVYARGCGWADRAAGVRNRADTRFVIASISKTVTAGAVALLVARGRLGWDDPIARHLPDVPADKAGITLAQLLTHSSGLADLYRGESQPERDAAVHAILAEPLADVPGRAWHYSNDGYVLLAAIVERTTGEPFETFIHRELLAPAGMTATGYSWDAPQPAGAVAHGYDGDTDSGDPRDKEIKGWGHRGAGGLLASAADLQRWAVWLDGGRGLPPAVQAQMLARFVEARPGLRDAMGWFLLDGVRGTRVLYHGGNETPQGFTADLRRYLDDDVVTVSTSNAMVDDVGPVGLRGQVSACVEAIWFGGGSCWMPPPVADRPADPRLAGTYQLASGGRLRVVAQAGGLAIGADGQEAIELLRPVDAARGAALREASARIERLLAPAPPPDCDPGCVEDRAALAELLRGRAAARGPLAEWRTLGTAPVTAADSTTFVQLRFAGGDEVLRVIWDDDRLGDLLVGAEWAATTPLVPQADGAFVASSLTLPAAVRIEVDPAGRTLRVARAREAVSAARVAP